MGVVVVRERDGPSASDSIFLGSPKPGSHTLCQMLPETIHDPPCYVFIALTICMPKGVHQGFARLEQYHTGIVETTCLILCHHNTTQQHEHQFHKPYMSANSTAGFNTLAHSRRVRTRTLKPSYLDSRQNTSRRQQTLLSVSFGSSARLGKMPHIVSKLCADMASQLYARSIHRMLQPSM